MALRLPTVNVTTTHPTPLARAYPSAAYPASNGAPSQGQPSAALDAESRRQESPVDAMHATVVAKCIVDITVRYDAPT